MTDIRPEVEALIAELKADLKRPEGRWGLHGRSSVDDDYFDALEYCIEKLEQIVNPI